MISDNRLGVEPPKDANGKAIPLDTETLYSTTGQVFHVNRFRYMTKEKRWVVSGYFEQGCKCCADNTFCFLLTPPDSWEKLIDDLRNAVSSSKYACECVYLNPREDNCEKCPALNQVCSGYAIADILARIEKLRGESDED